MEWISLIILIVVALWFVLAVRYMWKHKGTSSCGGGCNGDCSRCGKK